MIRAAGIVALEDPVQSSMMSGLYTFSLRLCKNLVAEYEIMLSP